MEKGAVNRITKMQLALVHLKKNTNAIKHGLFSKYLPKESMKKYPKLKRCIIKIDDTSVLRVRL